MAKYLILVAVLILAANSCTSSLILPNDPRINYHGRFDFYNVDNNEVWFGWSAVNFDIQIYASNISVLVKEGTNGNLYNIWDLKTNTLVDVISTTSGVSSVPIWENNQPEFVWISVERRTEALFGPAALLGFEVSDDSSDAAVDLEAIRVKKTIAPRQRRIEILGASMICGYGNEGTPPCHFTKETENVHKSFSALTAQILDAEYRIQCWSGKGVIRNNSAKNSTSADPFPYYYLRTVGMLDSPWDFKQWQLSGDDVVIIGLGSNDYSQPQQYWPTYEQFYQGYANLITFIQQSYNSTGTPPAVFCAIGALPGDPVEYLGRIVQDLNAQGNERVYFVDLSNTLTDPKTDFGCDGHASTIGDHKIAGKLSAAIKAQMGW
jgi:hypothetical protein